MKEKYKKYIDIYKQMFYNFKKHKGSGFINSKYFSLVFWGYIINDNNYECSLSEDEEEYECENVIRISDVDINEYNIKNYNNKWEVIKMINSNFFNNYIQTDDKKIIVKNIDTGMDIEIRKRGINESFGNDKYYLKLPLEIKKIKIATMKYLDKIIEYGVKRAEDAANYHDKNSKIRFAYLKTNVIIDNVFYEITIDIKKSPDGLNRFYIHNIKKKEDILSQSQCGWLADKISSNKV